ncbi:MAG: peptidoglycan/LPS O-acetylase OafA/YrhL [Oleiphilaceae bacterium]|jgi:peptidoglycan/LPS O-acetylase OafA/YrhL
MFFLNLDQIDISILNTKSADVAPEGKSAVFYLMPFRVFEFSIGAIMVWLIRYQPKSNLCLEFLSISALGMILYAVFTFDESTIFPYYNALLPCVGTALLILCAKVKYTNKLLSNPVSVNLGLISYSLYLVHWPIFVFYSYFKMGELLFLDKVLIRVASILLAYLLCRYVERPFRQGRAKESGGDHGFGLVCSC